MVWDNHNDCEHGWGAELKTSAWWGEQPNLSTKQASNSASIDTAKDLARGAFCECGAWRGCLGLEPTPELYVSHMVEIFRELKRVLRSDGTLWLNLGDSYCASPKGNLNGQDKSGLTSTRTQEHSPAGISKLPSRVGRNPKAGQQYADVANAPHRAGGTGMKPKDLIGIPWRVAFALQADGWYLRSDIIWAKPNPMPESVTDRPTRSHEYIFLLSKREKYFYDADAIKERGVESGWNAQRQRRQGAGCKIHGLNHNDAITLRNDANRVLEATTTRNKRSVWTVTTQPFSGAHFATFPPDLIKPCILAGAPIGGVVIDPFAGSGTTGKVAIELGRKAILIEPKLEYIEMIKRRCQTTIGLPMTG